MYPQTYGTRYFSKRFPTEAQQQLLSLSDTAVAAIKYGKIFFLQLFSFCTVTGQFLPKTINKNLLGPAEGTVTVKKHISKFFVNKVLWLSGSEQDEDFGIDENEQWDENGYAYLFIAAWFASYTIITAAAAVRGLAKVIKHIILTPIAAVCKSGSAIKKQAQKVIQGIAIGLASITKHWQLDIEFIGPFAPGDVVTINSRTLEVTLNGENALHLTGKDDFPTVRPGEQVLTYADEEGSRTVRVKIRWKDRWL
jgi:hypothetical protein